MQLFKQTVQEADDVLFLKFHIAIPLLLLMSIARRDGQQAAKTKNGGRGLVLGFLNIPHRFNHKPFTGC
jgi:hypothetical protein